MDDNLLSDSCVRFYEVGRSRREDAEGVSFDCLLRSVGIWICLSLGMDLLVAYRMMRSSLMRRLAPKKRRKMKTNMRKTIRIMKMRRMKLTMIWVSYLFSCSLAR